MNKKLFTSILILFLAFFINAQTPVKWTYESVQGINNESTLKFSATIDKGWNIYSTTQGEGGPIATSIQYSTAVEKIGNIEESGTIQKGYDSVFEMDVTKLKGNVVLSQKIKSSENKISGTLTYMACNDKTCLPPEDVSFEIAIENTPITSTTVEENIATDSTDALTVESNEWQKASPAYRAFDTALINKDCSGGKESNKSIIWLFIFGFGGGLLALLTPCVFPMIPITVGYFHQEEAAGKNRSISNALIFGISIILIYVALGTIITLTLGSDGLNWLSTHWIPNVIFFLIFIAFALSFFGLYELTLPTSWLNSADSMSRTKGGIVGIFFMAFTLALVSFSCTGPIIGSQLVEASHAGLQGPIIVMLGFAIALALPFTIFAAFPNSLNALPKSGGWLNSVKVILGFLEIALAFKFLSVADLTEHWGLLKYETFLAIWIAVAIGMILYLLGILRFKYDSPIAFAKLPIWRWVLAAGLSALAIYMFLGFKLDNRPLKLFSGIFPPSSYSFLAEAKTTDDQGKTTCAGGIPCFKVYEDGLKYAKKINKPIIIDFTGHGCVNCRKIEENVWINPEVKRLLTDEYVLISLYVDDREKLPKEKQYVSQASGVEKKIRKVGNYWSDFQISNFQTISQPYYVLVSNKEKILRKPIAYEEGKEPKKFIEFLNCGLEVNQKLK